MKKRLWIYPVLCLFGGLILACYIKHPISLPPKEQGQLWKSKRPLPDKIALNAYLRGNIARGNHDLDQAVQAYTRVLETDPQNLDLLQDTYTMAMIQGNAQKIIPYLPQIKGDKLLANYLRVVHHFQQKENEKALQILNSVHKNPTDTFLIPLVKAWVFADKNEKEAAIAQINTLTDTPFIAGYQKVLLGSYFRDNDLIQKGIVQMGDHAVPAVGYFPLLKEIVSKTGHWEKSALHKKYTELSLTYPATAEILLQVGEKQITPEKGMAEVFYLASALAANGHFSREESLAANSLALLLQPNKQISLIWGAELAEGLHLPFAALSYYERLTFRSATLQFKKAAALMLLHRSHEALPLLEQLKRTNQNSVPLLTLLGQAYQETDQRQKALNTYNQLIPLLEKSPKNEPLVHAYLSRGTLYGLQDSEKMLDDLRRALALAPENAILLNNLGYHQLENGDIDEGFELIQRAHQKKPNDPYILDSLAFGYWRKGQPSIALPFAEHALDLMPQSALINAHLGDIYAALGRHREAGFQYKKALDLNTDLTDTLIHQLHAKLKEKK